jgi:hypothetical protein
MAVEHELACFPCGPDKRPLIAGGFKSAVTGRDRIEDLFRRYPGALVGAPTGAVSGVDVLDIDRGGEDWLSLYEATHGLPATRIVGTRSGGLHLFFQHHDGMRCSAGLLAPNVDVRSTGGYIILWDRAGCRVLSEAPVAPWPEPMLMLLDEATEARRYTAPDTLGASLMSSAWKAQADHEVPRSLYFMAGRLTACPQHKRRVIGVLRPLVRLRDGRNRALYDKAVCFRVEFIPSGIISYAAAESLLIESSTLNGYIAKRGVNAAVKTIRSGLGLNDINEARNSYDGGLAS